jgi:hypothetical protein
VLAATTGEAVLAPDLRAALTAERHGPAWLELATTGGTARAKGDRCVLVAHSGAGRLVAGVPGDVEAIVLLDAGLPGERTHRAGAPPEFDQLLADLAAGDGVLPPWPRWWPPEAMATLVPDEDRRRLVVDDAPAVPSRIFDELLPEACAHVDDGVRVAYVAFGVGYAAEADEADRRGWPVRRLGGGAAHLHHLVAPDAVAATIVGIVR